MGKYSEHFKRGYIYSKKYGKNVALKNLHPEDKSLVESGNGYYYNYVDDKFIHPTAIDDYVKRRKEYAESVNPYLKQKRIEREILDKMIDDKNSYINSLPPLANYKEWYFDYPKTEYTFTQADKELLSPLPHFTDIWEQVKDLEWKMLVDENDWKTHYYIMCDGCMIWSDGIHRSMGKSGKNTIGTYQDLRTLIRNHYNPEIVEMENEIEIQRKKWAGIKTKTNGKCRTEQN